MFDSDSQAILGALTAAQAERPDLAELLALYHDLAAVQLTTKAKLPARSALDPHVIHQRAEAGLPQLSFDELELEAASFGALVADVRGVLAHHNVGGEPSPAACPGSELIRRAHHLFEKWPMLTAPDDLERDGVTDDVHSDPLLDHAIALALAPYLQHAAEPVLPVLEQVHWGRPICPVCGGQPNLALLEAERGARKLVCSRCDSVWDYTRVGCPYCLSQEQQTYFLGQGALYRLYVCPTCKRYLKTMDLREAGRAVRPAVERLLSVHMDLAARQRGYVG
jgi:formate dehydrogenase accessory protein FdhE